MTANTSNHNVPVEHEVPLQFTNLRKPQLPWATLVPTLHERNLELEGWPEDVPLPGSSGYNPKGVNNLSADDMRKVYWVLSGITFKTRQDLKGKERARRQEEHEDEGPARLAKKAKTSDGKKSYQDRMAVFRLS